MKAAYDSVSQLDNQHQTLSHDHGTTRAALQQLIAEVHGPRTTLADGAGHFDLVESKLEQYKTTTDSIETTLPSLATKEELLTYITPGELSTTTVQTATHLSPGGTINGHAFTGIHASTMQNIGAPTGKRLAGFGLQHQFDTDSVAPVWPQCCTFVRGITGINWVSRAKLCKNLKNARTLLSHHRSICPDA